MNKATLISIHQNHFELEKEWGIQIWYSPNDNLSKELADSILNISKDNLQKNNRRENKKLQDDNYQSKMAYSIMLGYGDYLSKEL